MRPANDDPQYIVRLVGQVVQVSVETVRLASVETVRLASELAAKVDLLAGVREEVEAMAGVEA